MDHIIESLNGTWLLAWDQTGMHSVPVSFSGLQSSDLPKTDACVPGNFELDLERAGILPEIYFGKNVLKVQEYESATVIYGRRFEWNTPVTGREELVFEGADTFMSVYLNGKLLGHTDNALIQHRLLLQGLIQGCNEIVCVFHSCIQEAAKHRPPASLRHLEYGYESLYVRKAPSAYGWDIMPRTVSCGLWRDVYIEVKPEQRIENIYLYTASVSAGQAELCLYYDLTVRNIRSCSLILEGTCGESSFRHQIRPRWLSGNALFTVSSPLLWWPRGYGDPNLYRCVLSLYDQDTLVDSKEFTLGIRTIKPLFQRIKMSCLFEL